MIANLGLEEVAEGFSKVAHTRKGKKSSEGQRKEKVTECLDFEGEKEEVDVEQKCRGVSVKERVW